MTTATSTARSSFTIMAPTGSPIRMAVVGTAATATDAVRQARDFKNAAILPASIDGSNSIHHLDLRRMTAEIAAARRAA